MAYLLRTFLLLITLATFILVGQAFGIFPLEFSHQLVAIPLFLAIMFVQAFVMFYFIGVSKLADNVFSLLHGKDGPNELFENPPKDLSPYKKKTLLFKNKSLLWKRQTIPWTMLVLALGTLAFLLGGAFDTGLVERTTHSGVALGMIMAQVIGFAKQWKYLGKAHTLLRELKGLFDIPDSSM